MNQGSEWYHSGNVEISCNDIDRKLENICSRLPDALVSIHTPFFPLERVEDLK